MKFHWLLPGALGIWLLSSPVQARQLQSWRYDAELNRLEFTTSSRVQPRAKLIFNPTRLVIDLPGVKLGASKQEQLVSAPGIRAVRVAQFNPETTRIVVEVSRGYTLDSEQVRFQGYPQQWRVQLPTPQRLQPSPPARRSPPVAIPPRVDPFNLPRNPDPGSVVETPIFKTQVENLRVTSGGFFVSTRGEEPPKIKKVERSEKGTEINIDIEASIDRNLTQRELAIDSKSVKRVRISQLNNSPPITRITLSVTEDSPDWWTQSNNNSIVILPRGGNVALGENWSSGMELASVDPGLEQTATIQSVQLLGSRLLIRADRPVNAMGRWETPAKYKLIISPAQLSNQNITPQLPANGPLSQLTIEQSGLNRVEIGVVPVPGFTIDNFNQSGEQLFLPLSRLPTRTTPVPPVVQPPQDPIWIDVPPPQVPPPINPPYVPSRPPIYPQAPGPRNSRIVVAIDPGHGGRDPGAVGIGGLREKDITLDISRQVSTILQQQGIQAVMTRYDDREIDLQPRVDFAERVNASVFVSIHANAISLSRPDVNGLETYYYDRGRRLATTIHQSILQTTSIPDRRVRRARFYVLRKTTMPAVLVETGFVTGADDAVRLRNPAYRRVMAEAIARGILQYLGVGKTPVIRRTGETPLWRGTGETPLWGQ